MEDAWKRKIPLLYSEIALSINVFSTFMEDGRENGKIREFNLQDHDLPKV
jgi:hypothetical protein